MRTLEFLRTRGPNLANTVTRMPKQPKLASPVASAQAKGIALPICVAVQSVSRDSHQSKHQWPEKPETQALDSKSRPMTRNVKSVRNCKLQAGNLQLQTSNLKSQPLNPESQSPEACCIPNLRFLNLKPWRTQLPSRDDTAARLAAAMREASGS